MLTVWKDKFRELETCVRRLEDLNTRSTHLAHTISQHLADVMALVSERDQVTLDIRRILQALPVKFEKPEHEKLWDEARARLRKELEGEK